jgi:nucleotide-binding universal stress UspA family protein
MTARSRNVLIATDLGPSAAEVIHAGGQLARLAGAHAWLIHVAEPEPDFVGLDAGPQSVRIQLAEEFHEKHTELQKFAEGLRENGLQATALLIQGRAGEKVLEEAKRLQATYLVLGTHHRSILAPFSGSLLPEIVRKTPCPVLIVPQAGEITDQQSAAQLPSVAR